MNSTGSMFSHIECTSCKKIFSKNKILKLCPEPELSLIHI